MAAFLAKHVVGDQMKSVKEAMGDESKEQVDESEIEEARREAEERRKEKRKKMEEEREEMRQHIRDKYGLSKKPKAEAQEKQQPEVAEKSNYLPSLHSNAEEITKKITSSMNEVGEKCCLQ
ncbi:DgyrCDS13722 [Dimorphilus gyrociliatus]|uniref:DgyrCDS13722 n=1 Tax=Dimorphilus gyrociliatus TaxID=2664684 RepID=A0A7I8WBI7_9ANNE|nr:DgyrCDS13722 [Dimorphilus gyrociliatus]